ncbi:MAG: hypothetical protein AAFN91_13490 [Pseudomonadota bacterium]
MTRLSFSLMASAVVLAACAPSPESALNATCNAVMADPQVRDSVVRAGLTVDTYCDCVTTVLLVLPENERTRAVESFELIETRMADHEGDAEAAFEAVRDAARAEGATPEMVATYRNLDELGDQLDLILDEIEEAGGTCPA